MPLLTVKATDAEHAGWKARATECGLTLSAWVRMILNGVAGGGYGSPPPAQAAGPVRGGTGLANHSAAGPSGLSGAAEAATGAPMRGAPDSGPGTHRQGAIAASSGTGVSTPSDPPADGPASAGAPAPSKPFLVTDLRTGVTIPVVASPPCDHPSEDRRQRNWGTICGLCGKLDP